VRGHDLDVLDVVSAVWPLVFDADVGKLDVIIDHRKLVLLRPPQNLCRVALGSPRTVPPAAVRCLEERLIFALQLVVQNDSVDAIATFDQALGGDKVRTVQPDVMRELTGFRDAGVERLGSFAGA
jgi:hypothetical protein